MHKVIIGKKRLKRLVSLPTTGTRKWRSKDSREGAGSVSFSGKNFVDSATAISRLSTRLVLRILYHILSVNRLITFLHIKAFLEFR